MKWLKLILVILLSGLPGQAAENTEKKKAEASEKSVKSGDVFIPSEEISEDIAIAFPVDI